MADEDDELMPRLVMLLADDSRRLTEEQRDGLAIALLSLVSAERAWFYVFLLCVNALQYAEGPTAREAMGEIDLDAVVEALVMNHRINEALHLSLYRQSGEGNGEAPPALRLPARLFNLPGTDRWVTIEDIREILADIRTKALKLKAFKISTAVVREWTEKAVKRRFKSLNDRMKDGGLMLLMRHAMALSEVRWRRLTKPFTRDAAFARVHYATAFLTASIRVGGVERKRSSLLTRLIGPYLSEIERTRGARMAGLARRLLDSHFAARLISNRVFALLNEVRRAPWTGMTDLRPFLQAFYALTVGPVLELPAASARIAAMGERPTLVVATHGAFAQTPFAAFHDGVKYLVERFNVVQAPPIYSNQPFEPGDMDWEAMTGGEPAPRPMQIRVLADTKRLTWAREEIARYELLKARYGAKSIEIVDGAREWSEQTLRWLLRGRGAAVLSCHVRPGRGVETWETCIETPDGRLLPLASCLDQPLETDLLVLAGCVSHGKTDWFGGNEDSLVSRCRKAGVKAVVSTLWPVDDQAAQIYNETLVSELCEGRSRAAAHGAAQRAVMNTFSPISSRFRAQRLFGADDEEAGGAPARIGGSLDHPYFWAPFVLSGAWR